MSINQSIEKVTPVFLVKSIGTANYLVINGTKMVEIKHPVSLSVENLQQEWETTVDSESPVKVELQYDLKIECDGTTTNIPLSYELFESETPSEDQIQAAILQKFLSACSPGEETVSTQLNQKQTEAKDPKKTLTKRLIKGGLLAFAAILSFFAITFLYLMFASPSKKTTDAAVSQDAQLNKDYIEALSKGNGKDFIDIDSQTRLTQETLKSIGLDPSKAAEIGCLSQDQGK